ncbi:MAG: YdcF family protein [Methyloceanibacter sp.]
MFFYIAKGLWFLLQPSTLIALLIGYGAILIWTGWARWGRRFVTIGAILLLVAGLSPLGNALILPLEDRFPRANLDDPPPPTGFIILGGAEDRLVGEARGAPTLNEAGERMVEAAMLARRFPEAKIAFSGGDAGILYTSGSEAEGAQTLLTALGVPQDRLILEAKSRDTYENAAYLKQEFARAGELGPGKRWLLITSAYHMPRAMGAFRQAGFNVEPWPLDYRTRGKADLTRPFDKVSEGLRRVDVASREWVGLLAYWLTGRSDALFPGPQPLAVAGCDLARPGANASENPPASPCRPNL